MRWSLSILALGLILSGGILFSTAGLASADELGPTDISVGKSVDEPGPEVGDTIIYTIMATNTGTGVASGIRIIDLLPNGVTLSSTGSASQGSVDISALPIIAWSVGDLASQSRATLEITVRVDSGTQGEVITNTAILSAVDQADSDRSNDSISVTITVADSAVVEPEEGTRRGFVGTVQGPSGAPVSSPLALERQGADQPVEIVLPEEYDLTTPGGPRAGEFVNGAEVGILARWENGQWVAERVLVKPVKPLPPVNGVVVDVEVGAFTIETPNGGTQTIQVPPGAPVFTNGEMVTIFLDEPLPEEDQEGKDKVAQATGLVRVAQVARRLQTQLDRLAAAEDNLPNGNGIARGRQLDRLAGLLEDYEALHLARLDRALEQATETARAAIERAREKAQTARERAQDSIERAREKAEEAREKAQCPADNGQPPERQDEPQESPEPGNPGQGSNGGNGA